MAPETRSEADCDIRRSRMLPPDVWDYQGRSQATWTEVVWRGRIAWRTGQDFGHSRWVCCSTLSINGGTRWVR